MNGNFRRAIRGFFGPGPAVDATPPSLEPPMTNVPRAWFFRSELQRIADHTAMYPSLETGGSLFGYFTHTGLPIVLRATGPGPRATRTSTSFFQDPGFLAACASRLFSSMALQHVGEWHSHHSLGLRMPSGGDDASVVDGMEARNFQRFLLVIANVESNGTSMGGFLYRRGHEVGEATELQVLAARTPADVVAPPLPFGQPCVVPAGSTPWVAREAFGRDWEGSAAGRRRMGREYKALQELAAYAGGALEFGKQSGSLTLERGWSARWSYPLEFPLAPARLWLPGQPMHVVDPSTTLAHALFDLATSSQTPGPSTLSTRERSPEVTP